MKILILNWRDIKNPMGGGAEIATHELAKQWINAGFFVTQFTSEYENCKKEEVVDGVSIIRRGHPDIRYSFNLFNTVHFRAFIYYIKNKDKFDLIIDEIHGLPFFTPLYAKEKSITFICEIARNIWLKEFGYFLGGIGRLVEKLSLRLLYSKNPVMTISNSTKNDLVKEGIPTKNILVLHLGINVPQNLPLFEKEKTLTLMFLGRLSRPKGIEDAIRTFSLVKKKIDSAKLWIVGTGSNDYQDFLKSMTRKLKIEGSVIFFGFVSEEKKYELLARSHILIFPSVREGWGLTVIEANRMLTPVIGYDSQGLKDSIVNGKTGILCKFNTPSDMKDNVFLLYENKLLYKKMQNEGYRWSKKFAWEKAGEQSIDLIKKIYEDNKN